MRSRLYRFIKQSLNFILHRGETKMSAELQKLLNDVVTTPNEIDSIIILDPKNATSLFHNTEFSKERHGDELSKNHDTIAGSLSGVHSIMNTLKEFGDSSKRGDLKYAVFQLSSGILVLYFLQIHGAPTVVAFISGTSEGLGLLLKHSEKNIGQIEKLLEKAL